MKFTGKWASPDYLDAQLNIMPDGAVYVTFSNCGEYSVRAQAELTDDKLTWTACGITGVLECTENGENLTGTCTENGVSDKVMFYKATEAPEALPYHHAPQGELVTLPDAFPVSLGQLVGQWKTETPYNAEMNIFDRDGKMELLLCFDEKTAWPPVSVWIDGGDIVWQINDSFNRGVCTIHFENGELAGTYRQLGHNAFPPVCFRKLSDTPAERSTDRSEVEIQKPDATRLRILKDNAAYNSGEEKPIETEYVLDGDLPEEIYAYDYANYLDGKSGDDIAFACLDFICDHFHHYGSSGMPNRNSHSLADFLTWCREHDNRTNCRGLSIMLANILRYNGIRAQHITCQPYEEPFDDCHVVVDCWLPSGKRVMLDPTYRLYLRDASGEYVSLPKLREILLADGKLIPNQTAAYTGREDGTFDLADYREYMAKNTLRFSKDRVNADGRDEYDEMWLFPTGYPFEKICNPEKVTVCLDDQAFWG